MKKTINISLYKAHSKQALIHKSLIKDKKKVCVVVAGRQSGKTLAAIFQAIYWALNKKNQEILFVSPTFDQTTKVQNQFLKILKNSRMIISAVIRGQSSQKISFINGSTIHFRSSKSENSLRGFTASKVVMDELAFIKESVFKDVIWPMLNAAKDPQMLICSTPKGKNYLYSYYNLAEERADWARIHFTCFDNPSCNLEMIEEARQTRSEPEFNQEYLAQFIDKSSIYKNIDNICVLTIQPYSPSEKYFMGVDVGMKNDRTAISIMNSKKQQVYVEYFANIESSYIKNRIISLNQIYKPFKILIESNGIALPIISDLRTIHQLYNIEGFTQTVDEKQRIVSNMIYGIETGEVMLINDEKQKDEFKSIVVSFTKTGKPQYYGDYGHDDIHMATVLSLECNLKYATSGQFYVM